MIMSLRAVGYVVARAIARSNLLVVAGIASSQSARALLATTWYEMKSLDEESAEILKVIKGML